VIVAKGAARPLQRALFTAEAIHGENGLGGVELPAPTLTLDARHAVQVIHDVIEAHPGQITLVPVGPLTNVALAFLQYPDLPAKTREIILMGGSVAAGNATPAAEANIYHDAEAARLVFQSGVPIVMVDLTACAQARFTRRDADALRESRDPVARFVAAISDPYLRFAERFSPDGAAIHDALAVGIAADPLVARTLTAVRVDVETRGEFTYGATVTNIGLTAEHSEWRGDRFVLVDFPHVQANARYPSLVDGERFIRLFRQRMTQAAGGR